MLTDIVAGVFLTVNVGLLLAILIFAGCVLISNAVRTCVISRVSMTIFSLFLVFVFYINF